MTELVAQSPAIAWWGWIVMWGALVLALVAVLALGTWWLFRKFLTLMDDLGDLAESTALLEPEDAGAPPARQPLAVLATAEQVSEREAARQFHRTERRRSRHERRMSRARRITSVDASRRQWPADWYPR